MFNNNRYSRDTVRRPSAGDDDERSCVTTDAAQRPIITCDEVHKHLTQKPGTSVKADRHTGWILTVQSHIVVGENSRLVSFGRPADHDMKHPVRGFNIMFL